eukprot:1644279-Amphidinium_carterae.1
MTAKTKPYDQLGFFVMDFQDPFWQVPLAHPERAYYTGRLGGDILVYLRTAQGSRCGPLTWAALGGLVTRLTQSLFFDADDTDQYHRCKLQLFVDDPLAVLCGSDSDRQLDACIIALLWMALGFPLSIHKAQLSKSVNWCGCSYAIERDMLIVRIRVERVSELRRVLMEILGQNVLSKKLL